MKIKIHLIASAMAIGLTFIGPSSAKCAPADPQEETLGDLRKKSYPQKVYTKAELLAIRDKMIRDGRLKPSPSTPANQYA